MKSRRTQDYMQDLIVMKVKELKAKRIYINMVVDIMQPRKILTGVYGSLCQIK
jgi:hypothetical protein